MTSLRFRVVTVDGDVLADELASFDDVDEVGARHGELTDAALAAGRAVIMSVSDPDGIIQPFAVRFDPDDEKGPASGAQR